MDEKIEPLTIRRRVTGRPTQLPTLGLSWSSIKGSFISERDESHPSSKICTLITTLKVEDLLPFVVILL